MSLLNEIGAIVREARGRRSVRELARAAGVSAVQIEKLERGERAITTAELDLVARELELDPTALLSGRRAPNDEPSIFLRHRGIQDFDARAEKRLDRALDAGRALWTLNTELGHPTGLRRTRLGFRPCAPASQKQGYELARLLRAELGSPVEPLHALIDIAEESLEIAVLRLALGAGSLSAIGIRARGGAAAIVLNDDDPQARKNPALDRVNIAHEICHIVFDESAGGLHMVLDWREPESEKKVAREEQRARQFAAELLLPLDGLTRLLGAPKRTDSEQSARALVSSAREYFGTPWEIAVQHLHNRDFISLDTRDLLIRRERRVGGAARVAEAHLGLGRSRAVMDRVRRAHRADLITDGEARVALDIPIGELLPWM